MCVLHVQDSFCRIFSLKYNRKRQEWEEAGADHGGIISCRNKGRIIYAKTKTKEEK